MIALGHWDNRLLFGTMRTFRQQHSCGLNTSKIHALRDFQPPQFRRHTWTFSISWTHLESSFSTSSSSPLNHYLLLQTSLNNKLSSQVTKHCQQGHNYFHRRHNPLSRKTSPRDLSQRGVAVPSLHISFTFFKPFSILILLLLRSFKTMPGPEERKRKQEAKRQAALKVLREEYHAREELKSGGFVPKVCN